MILRVTHNKNSLLSANDNEKMQISFYDITFLKWERLNDAVFMANKFITQKLRNYTIQDRRPENATITDNFIHYNNYISQKNKTIQNDNVSFWSIDFGLIITQLLNNSYTIVLFGEHEFVLEITTVNHRHSIP